MFCAWRQCNLNFRKSRHQRNPLLDGIHIPHTSTLNSEAKILPKTLPSTMKNTRYVIRTNFANKCSKFIFFYTDFVLVNTKSANKEFCV